MSSRFGALFTVIVMALVSSAMTVTGVSLLTDEIFEVRRREVEAAPQDWRAWWRLASAYGEARDPRRGRRAMRKAVDLERAERNR